MRERGWRWAQATVWNVEKGERPLRLAEAEDLASILGVGLYAFTASEPALAFSEKLRAMSDSRARLMEATEDFLKCQWELAAYADAASRVGADVDLSEVEDWLKETPLAVFKLILIQRREKLAANRRIDAQTQAMDEGLSLEEHEAKKSSREHDAGRPSQEEIDSHLREEMRFMTLFEETYREQ